MLCNSNRMLGSDMLYPMNRMVRPRASARNLISRGDSKDSLLRKSVSVRTSDESSSKSPWYFMIWVTPSGGVRNLLGIGDLCIISIVDFERCFEVTVIVGSING